MPAYEGVVFAEMNANAPGALYQNVCFTTGETIGWFFAHRARNGGANPQVANFEIANSSGTVLQTLASQSTAIGAGWQTNSGTGTYTGATGVQRIQFRTTNPGSVGNFLDAIQIDLAAYAQFASATTSSVEGAASPTVPSITVSGKVDQAVTIPLTIVGGTATSGTDYVLTASSITIPVGNYSATSFPIPLVINDDSRIEADETIIIRLGTPSNSEIFLADLGCSGNPTLQATHTIVDNDVDLQTVKTLSSTNASPAEGDTVSFRIAVTNLGARAATGVSLTDLLPAGLTFSSASASTGSYNSGTGLWTIGNLAAGSTATLTLSGVVATGQAGNTLTNTTTAAVGSNVDTTRTSGDDLTESVVVTSTPGLSVTKTGVLNRGPDNVAGVGDVITYSFTVRNTGTTPLTNVTLVDTLPGLIQTGGPIATLPRGATDTTTFSATYTLTQADVDRGRVDNTVNATGRNPQGGAVNATGISNTPIPQTTGMTVVKTQTGGPTTVTGAGQVLNYTVVIRNTGNITQTNVRATDTLPNAVVSNLTGAVESVTSDGLLQPGETWTYTASYTVSQSDVDGGAPLVNSVLATSDQASPVSSAATTPVSRNPVLLVDKTVNRPTIGQAGPLAYTITVTNGGNVTLTGITISDILPDGTTAVLSGPTGDGGTPNAIDVGETWTYTTTYNVTQAQIEAGTARTNTVTVRAAQINAAVTDTAVTTIQRNPAIAIDKTVDKATISAPGLLTYTIKVTNAGNISLTGVATSDTLPGGAAGVLTGPTGDGGVVGTLDVGETWTYTTTYSASQANVDAGTALVNTARVNSTQTPTQVVDTATTTITRSPALTVRKTVDQASIGAPATLTYTIVVTNTGNVSLTGVVASDTLPGGAVVTLTSPSGDGGVVGTLEVGEVWTYTTTYPATQANIDAGAALVNTVRVNSTQTPTQVVDTATTTVSRAPALTVRKTVDQASISAPGTLNYTIVVTNTGNVSQTGVSVADVLPNGANAALTGPTGDGGVVGTLEVGEAWTYTTTYAATQANIDAGADLTNTVNVQTTQLPTPRSATAVTRVSRAPAMVVDKTVDLASIAAPGPLAYTITVRNTGNVSLTGVVASDTLPSGAVVTLASPTGDGGVVGTLDVGETWTYTTTYNVTQAEIDAGVSRTNAVSVTSANGASGNDTAVTSITRRAGFRVDKTVDQAVISAPGSLNYTIVVTNTGNVSLTGVTPTDTLPDGSTATLGAPVESLPGGTAGVLDVGETWTYTLSYPVNQARIELGGTLQNQVSVATNEVTAPQDVAVTSIARYYSLSIDKVVDQTSTNVVGTVLNYVVTLRNTGNVSLTGLSVTDTLPNGAAGVLTFTGGDADGDNQLDLTEQWTYSGSYTVTQADIDNGATLVNTARGVSAETPTPVSDVATTVVNQAAGILVEKDVDKDTISTTGPLVYTIRATNIGNTSLNAVTPVDTLPNGASGVLTGPTGDGGVPGVLDVGETWTWTATYNVSQAELNAGADLTNTVTITATDPGGNRVGSDSATTAMVRVPGLAVTKSVDRTRMAAPGTLNYTITLSNTGNVSLTGVTPVDTLPDGSTAVLVGPTGDGGVANVLDVGETWTYTTTFAVNQARIDAGGTLTNSLSVTTTQTPTPETASAATTVDTAPSLSVVKTVDQASMAAPGTLNYTIRLSNTGNVSLTGVNPVDTLPDGSTAVLSGPTGDGGAANVLDVGETWTYTATFAVNQARIDTGGTLTNLVSVTTTQTPAPATSQAQTTISGAPGLSVVKTVDQASIAAPGTLTYTIRLSNTGNVSLTGVTPVDTLPDGSTAALSGPTGDGGAANVLDVGETWTYTATFVVSQARIDTGGTLTNLVSVTTTQTPAPATSQAQTTIDSAPGLGVVKTVDQASISAPGTLTYTIRLSNTGNVSLTGVTPVDTLPDGSTAALSGPTGDGGAANVLDVGETWTYTATFVVSQARFDTGAALVNTVSATATQVTTPQTGSATTTISQAPDLAVIKTVDQTTLSTPGALTYTIQLRNTGNVSLTGVNPVDTLPDGATAVLSGPTGDGGVAGVLDVGETWTYTTTFAGTQARIDATTPLVNNLSATTAETPTPRTATATTTPDSTPTILISKTVDQAVVSGPTRLRYKIQVTNTGNRSLSSVVLTDTLSNGGVVTVGPPQESLAGGVANVLEVGEVWTWNATYDVVQADIDAAAPLVNTASVTTNLTAIETATATTSINGMAHVLVEKDVDHSQVSAPGLLTYVIKATNTGNIRLNTPVLTDTLSSGGVVSVGAPVESLPGGTAGVLDVGETWTWTATHAVTQAEIDAGADLVNTALITAQRPAGGAVTGDDTATTSVSQRIDLDLVKAGALNLGPDGRASVGDTATYAFAVTNTGNVTLQNLTLADVLPGMVLSGGPIASLAARTTDSTTFTGIYTLTQADVDAGRLVNTATVTGQTPGGASVSAVSSVTLALTGAPTLTLSKTATLNDGGDGRADVGDTITYGFAIGNSGNVTVTNLSITDTLAGIVVSGGPIASLAPGAIDTTSITAVYVLTQADIDAGRVINTATAAGQDPGGNPITATDTVTTPIPGAPRLTLDKTGVLNDGGDGRADVGDRIVYAFAVTNTGNVTLSNIGITDALPGVVLTGGPIASLAPGASDATTVTGFYVLTQADIDAGQVLNTATASGTAPGGAAVTASDALTTPITGAPALTLAKTGVVADGGDGRADVGDVINYAFTVTNTGNQTISNVSITDALAGVTVSGGPIASLAPGASDATTITARYVLTQADIDAGQVVNTATANGTAPGGPVSAGATATSPLSRAPAITLIKTGLLNDGGNGRADVGDVITYSFTVRNTGNVTVTNLTLSDPLPGIVLAGGPIASLAPGASDATSFTATYVLTQADVDAGQVPNTATTTGQAAGGATVTASASAIVPTAGAVGLTLDKTGVLNDGGDGRPDVGDIVTYAFTVANTGSVTITNVTISDALAGVVVSGGPIASLPPGGSDSTTITARYALTQADIDAGRVINTATATGTGAGGLPATATDTLTLPLVGAPGLLLDKTGALNDGGDGRADVGDTIVYAFTVTNTGNVTATDISITDTLAGVVLTGGPIASLAPGATDATTIIGRYVLTQADIDAGQVVNAATATGKNPAGDPITGTDTVTTPIAGAPSLTLDKTATLNDAGNGRPDAGDVVTYAFAVTNTGNVTVTNLVIADILPGLTLTGGPIPSLAPGATDATTITGRYVLTQADIDAGRVINTATATGVAPGGGSVTATDSVTTPIAATAQISAVKTATLTTDLATPGVGNARDVISYAVTVTNTGNTTLENLVVGDSFMGGAETLLTCQPTVLAPGVTANCAVYTHTITNDEANAGGQLNNTVSARANALGRPAITAAANAAAAITVEPDPTDLQVSKKAAPRDVRTGDVVRYTVTIDNIGIVDATDATVIDTPPAGFTYVEGSLSVDDADDAFRLAGVNPLRVDQIDVKIGQRATITYLMRVGAGVRPGTHINRVQARDGDRVSNIAEAEVRLVADPLIDESLIVGTVFDDRDGDGWQDEGEPGIPGVRIASVEGLIMETDQFGRYHLVGVDGGPWERGRNFILKVDPVTLPPGSRFTTDNPLVRRITPGLPVRFDFGVTLPRAPTGQEARP